MTTTVNQKQTKKVIEQPPEETVAPTDLNNEQQAKNPFDEVQTRARMAYLAYIEAQRDVANAYKLRDRQDQESFKEVEREAYQTYEKTIEKALKTICNGNKPVKYLSDGVRADIIKALMADDSGNIDADYGSHDALNGSSSRIGGFTR